MNALEQVTLAGQALWHTLRRLGAGRLWTPWLALGAHVTGSLAGVGRVGAQALPQPFTAPIVSPFTTYFWKIMVRMIAGAMMATAAAMTAPQSTSA